MIGSSDRPQDIASVLLELRMVADDLLVPDIA
jgi:hypothetical protein